MANQMIDGEARDVRPPDEAEAGPTQPAGQPNFDPYRSLVRLAVGGLAIGGDLLLRRLRDYETARPAEAEVPPALPAASGPLQPRHVFVGMAFSASETARRAFNIALGITGMATRLGLAPLRSIARHRPLKGIGEGFETLVHQGETIVEQWAEVGRAEEARSHNLAQYTVEGLTQDVMAYLSGSPELQSLVATQAQELPAMPETSRLDEMVRKLAGNYIAYLRDHPQELDGVVNSQADVYIDHLSENPEKIQALVQVQSVNLLSEISDEVRERTATADSLLEMLARKVLHRLPREQLPEPPALVKARAKRAYLRSDFVRERKRPVPTSPSQHSEEQGAEGFLQGSERR